MALASGSVPVRKTDSDGFIYYRSVMTDESLNGLRNAIGYARALAGDMAGARRAWQGVRWTSPYPEPRYPIPLEHVETS